MQSEIGVVRMERKDPEQGALLRRRKNEWVAPAFEGRVLPVDEGVSDACARLDVPAPRPVLDSLIAATPIIKRLTLVTQNERDFAGMPVAVIQSLVDAGSVIGPPRRQMRGRRARDAALSSAGIFGVVSSRKRDSHGRPRACHHAGH